jgi:hypothetical protein
MLKEIMKLHEGDELKKMGKEEEKGDKDD